jgi:eukaryotic-like serine/threonine-protein kinase
MAPEQAKKQPIDGRADVYSCGVMLWELLSWAALPQKGDPIERWRKAANPSWDPPSKMNSAVTRDVDVLVLKALRKDPQDRYISAKEFGDALRHARQRHAPDVTEKDLGALLSRVFTKEKLGEDAVLSEVVYGRTQDEARKEVTRRVQYVPPTALAFEHTAVLAPAEILKNAEEITDPGRPSNLDEGTPTPARDPRLPPPGPAPAEPLPLAGTRTSFGVTFAELVEPHIGASFISEIEGIGDSGEAGQGADDGADTRSLHGRPPNPLKRVALFGVIFVLAASLGFLGMWFALK